MVELFTTGPANILKLDRGTLAPGAPADVTVFDLDTEWTYDVQQSFSKSRNSPFGGRRFRGGPLATIVGGEIVWTFSGQDARVITGRPRRGLRLGLIGLVILLFVLLIGARWAASLLIEYSWWKELGQVETWIDLYAYSTLPIAAATFITWIVLLIAHARGVKFAGGRVSDYPIYSRISSVALLALAFFVSDASIDNWTVLRFAGSRALKNIDGFPRPDFRQAGHVLSFRSAFLVRSARLHLRRGDPDDPGLLAGGARLATAIHAARYRARARSTFRCCG